MLGHDRTSEDFSGYAIIKRRESRDRACSDMTERAKIEHICFIPCRTMFLNGVDLVVRLHNERGLIEISNDIFTKLTGDAATNCFGVKGMTVRSVTDGLVHLLRIESMGKGVHVTCNNDDTISIELHIAVDQGVNIPVLCKSIMDEVRYKVTKGTGVEVKRIDVYVESMILG